MKQLIDFSRHDVARVHLRQLVLVACSVSRSEKLLDEALPPRILYVGLEALCLQGVHPSVHAYVHLGRGVLGLAGYRFLVFVYYYE